MSRRRRRAIQRQPRSISVVFVSTAARAVRDDARVACGGRRRLTTSSGQLSRRHNPTRRIETNRIHPCARLRTRVRDVWKNDDDGFLHHHRRRGVNNRWWCRRHRRTKRHHQNRHHPNSRNDERFQTDARCHPSASERCTGGMKRKGSGQRTGRET